MGLYSNFPYTNFHEMNLDWILKELKELVDEWDSFGGNVTSEAHVSSTPEVTVSGNLKTGLNFDFGLVEGPRGQAGPEGPQGPEGKGLEILGVYATLSELQNAHPTGTAGDIYLVGSSNNYVMYVWSEDQNSWLEGGALTSPSPSTTAPLMDGVASAGSLTTYSRADHVHPSDNSKQDLLVSGNNIKTLNGYTLLGNGDLSLKTINDEAVTGSGDIAVQEPLVSGTNIKTVNSNSLLGQGDIAVQEPLVSGSNIKTVNGNNLLGSGDITIQAGGMTSTLLWTNANPDSTFAGQTINISNLSSYNYLYILARFVNASDVTYPFLLKNISGTRYGCFASRLQIRGRDVTIGSDSIVFSDDMFVNTYGNEQNPNTGCIPVQIYGIN